jgi:hypothetical protein
MGARGSCRYMDLQPYSHDCFSKISRTLFDFLNNTYWVSLFWRNNLLLFWTGVSCFSVTLFYSTHLALTDRWQRVKYTRYAWAGGTFFPVVLLFQFFVLAGNRFRFYTLLMYLEYHTVVVLWLFFWLWREIVLGVTYVLSVQYSCAVVSVFFCGRKANLVRSILLNPIFFLVHRNKLSVTVYLFLALYGSTTIQSQLFLNNIENFVWFPKQYLLVSLF